MAKAVVYLLSAASGLLGAPALASGEGAPVVAVLRASDRPGYHEAADAFFRRLESLSIHAQRRNVDLDGAADTAQPPDFVLALGPGALARSQGLLQATPVVFAFVLDPKSESSASAEHHGVSGAASAEAFIALIHAIAPDARRVGVVHHHNRSELFVRELARAAKAKGIETASIWVETAADVPAAVVASDADAILAAPDHTLWNGAVLKAAVLSTLRSKRPLFGWSSAFTRSGAVASLGIEDYAAIGEQAGDICALLLRTGHAPEPAESPARTTSTSINLVVAHRLGLVPPPSLVAAAREVFR